MAILEKICFDPTKGGQKFANELRTQIGKYFSFILDDKDKGFQPIFWVCSFLSPFHRMVLPKDKMPVITKYMKGKLLFGKYLTKSK